jgi:hypothetical protein
MDAEETQRGTPYWTWASLLGRVFALEIARCPWCHQGTLWLIAVITQGEVIRKILCHLKLAADPPPLAPARSRQVPIDWVA